PMLVTKSIGGPAVTLSFRPLRSSMVLISFLGFSVTFTYFTDEEYERAFFEFGGIREKIADRLQNIRQLDDGLILDLLSGHGLLSAEMALRFPNVKIIGTGLSNDVESYKRVVDSDRYPEETWSDYQYIECDVCQIPLESSSCDIVTNFMGLEDLRMTSGKKGVEQTFSEIARVAKPGALVELTLVEYGSFPEEKLAREIWSTIGLGAVYSSREYYLEQLKPLSMNLVEEMELVLQKKMTASQAREELEFACEHAPRIFSDFGVSAVQFDELWKEYSDRIYEHGMAYWSRIRVLILRKE
ncbi:MAG: methyltransferase domain-containing protein, partial [Candidatus Hodarchaeota archaeon]